MKKSPDVIVQELHARLAKNYAKAAKKEDVFMIGLGTLAFAMLQAGQPITVETLIVSCRERLAQLGKEAKPDQNLDWHRYQQVLAVPEKSSNKNTE